MKVFELINFNRELLKKLQDAGIRLDDARYIDLYSDYVDMYQQGEKVSYIVAALSEKYAVSERKVYGLLKRFQSELQTICSVMFAICCDDNVSPAYLCTS